MAEFATATSQSMTFAVRITALKNALFQSLSVMQKRTTGHALLSTVGVVVKWLQLMAFLFINDNFRWDKDVIQPIRVLSFIPSPAGWFKVLSPTFLLALFFISFVWVFFFCSLLVFTVRNFLFGRIPSLMPLKVLASIGQFSATVAYIPLLTMLLSVFMCDNVQPGMTDLWTGYRCMVDGHLSLVVLSSVFATVFVCLAALFALVFYDNHPLSPNTAAKVHGRSEFIMLLVKTILILTIEIFPLQINNVWVLVALNIAAACVWISLTLYYMPLIHFAKNSLMCALGCVYLWGGICLVMGMAGPWINAATLLYVGSPFAATVGVWLTQLRRKSVLGTAAAKLSNVYEVDMKARFMLQQALEDVLARAAQSASKYEAADSSAVAFDDRASLLGPTTPTAGLTRKGSMRAGDDGPTDERTAHFEGITTPRSVTEGKSKRHRDARSKRSGAEETDAEIFAAAYRACDAESRERMLRDKLPASLLREVQALYKDGATRFPHSAILHMFDSRFYSVFKNDRYLATSHLLLANRLNPSLDVAFLCFQARRAAETASASGALTSAMHRVSFDKHLADARVHTLRAAREQVSFWQELCDTKPDINRLHTLSSAIAAQTSLAEKHFKEAFLLHPQSLSAMRLFAQYNLCVANNPEKAAAISAEADRIEDQKNKEQTAQRAGSSTDGYPFFEEVPLENMTDAVAMMTVGASSRDLGIILSANSAACKIFGYTRLQLERRNVSVLIPSPFMEGHDSYMRRYMSTGEGVVVETSRQTLGLHRLGHLVPITLALRETALNDGTPAFIATLRPLNFSDHIVVMNEDWVIEGGTAGALMALQVEAATLSASEVCMADYFPLLDDSDRVRALLGRAHGDVVEMHLPGYASKDGMSPSAEAPGGRMPSARSPVARWQGQGGDALANSKSLWSQQASDVKACLATQVIKGHTVNVLTFRLLSANESAQRANALASRRASLASGVPLPSARPSFQKVVRALSTDTGPDTVRSGTSTSRVVILEQPSMGPTGDADSTSVGSGVSNEDKRSGDERDAQPLPEGHPEISAATFVGATCPVVSVTRRGSPFVPPLETGARASTPKTALSSSRKAGGVKIRSPRSSAGFSPAAKRTLSPGRARFSSQTADSDVQASSDGTDDLPGKPLSPTDAGSQQGPSPREHEEEEEEDLAGKSYARKGFDADLLDKERRHSLKDDGRGSVRSGGSSRHSNFGRGTLNKLRRILADSSSTGMSGKSVPGVNALYITGWILILLNIVLGAVSAALLDTSFNSISKNLRFAEVAGDTASMMVRARGSAVLRLAFRSGIFPVPISFDISFQNDLKTFSDGIAASTREMYSLVQGTSRETFFTRDDLRYADFDNAVIEPPGKISDGLLRELIREHVTAPWGRTDNSILVGSYRSTSFLAFISGAPAFEYVRSAVYEAYLASQDSKAAMETLVLWIFVAMGPCLSFVLLVVLVPILLFVDLHRDYVMEAFLDIPTLMALHLKSGAESRFRMLRADDDDGDDEDEEEDEEEAKRAFAIGGEEPGAHVDLEDGSVDWDAVIARIVVEASRAEKKRAKHGFAPSDSTAVSVSGNGASAAPSKRGWMCCRSPCACCCPTRPAASAAPQSAASPPPSKKVYNRSLCSRGQRAPGGGYYRSVVNADGSVSTFTRREFVKTHSSMLRLGIFLLPIVLMFAFYLALYLVTTTTLANVMAMASFTSLANIRGAQMITVRNQLMFIVALPSLQPELAFRIEWLNKQLATLDYVNSLLAFDTRVEPSAKDNFMLPDRDYTKAAGSESTGLPGLDTNTVSAIKDWHLKDACVLLGAADVTFNVTRCRLFNRGVMTNGLQAGMADFLVRMRRMRDKRWRARIPMNTTTGAGPIIYTSVSDWARDWEGRTVPTGPGVPGVDVLAPGGTYSTDSTPPTTGTSTTIGNLVTGATIVAPYSIVQEMLGDEFQIPLDMTNLYLVPGFRIVAGVYKTAGDSLISTYRLFLISFTGAFLAAFVLGTLALFLPALRALGHDVQSKQAMLLLLPGPVIAHVPSLRVMVLRVVEEHEGASGSSSSASRSAAKGVSSANAGESSA